jgi:hypothetical protein
MRLVRPAICAVVIALVGSTAGAVPPASAAQGTVWAGVCPIMTLNVDVPGGIGPLPAARSATFSGTGGLCVVERSSTPLVSVPVSFTGSLTSLAGSWSCDAGVLFGSAQLYVSDPSWPAPYLNLNVVNAGGVISITAIASASPTQFVGEGVFTQTNLCQLTPATSLTWLGTMAFEDPTVEL